MVKWFIQKILRVLLTPLRRGYLRRNGVQGDEVRKEIPNKVLLGLARDMIREGHTAIISVKGFSMRPFLEHCRDKVLLEAPGELKVGDAVLAEIEPDHYVLHRIVEVKPDSYVILGDNCISKEYGIRDEDILGVMTGFVRDGKEHSVSDTGYRVYSALWLHLVPLRVLFKKGVLRLRSLGR